VHAVQALDDGFLEFIDHVGAFAGDGVDAMDAFRRGIDQQPHIVEAAPTEPDPVRVALDGVRAAILTDAANRRGRSPATVEAPGTMEEEEPVLTGKTLRDAIAAERAADKARRAKDLELTPDEELPAGMTLKEAIAAERAKWKAEQEASAAELRAHGVNVTGGEFHGVQVSSNITNVGIGSRHRRRRP